MRRVVGLGVTLLLAGCALTPDYQRPELDVPEDYNEAEARGESLANLAWWELFQDPQLQVLIRTALTQNQDLAIALFRINEARSEVTITRADQFPQVDVIGSAGKGAESRDLLPGVGTRETYGLTADMAFQLDLWGRFRRATEAARADLQATEADYRNVTISLVADVASFYLLLRDLDERLAISRRTLKTRLESLAIAQARFDKGTVPELDVNQAQIEVTVAESSIAQFERRIVQTENALRVLLGSNPGPVKRGLEAHQQPLPPAIPAGLPAQLVQQRPDVVSAEAQLAAATARVGVAEALRFPAIALTGFYGGASEDLSDLNSSDANTWNLGLNLLAPIFNAGRLKAQAQAQRARAEQALLFYQAVLQQAFREVEDALVSVRTGRQEYEAQVRRVVAARNAARLSRARYDGGIVDYLEVLDAERTLFNAELEESATLQAYQTAIVELYKALGGGWSPEEEKSEETKVKDFNMAVSNAAEPDDL